MATINLLKNKNNNKTNYNHEIKIDDEILSGLELIVQFIFLAIYLVLITNSFSLVS